MAKKTIAVVQARMGSTRLPGKVMMEVNGTPIIEIVLRRAHFIYNVSCVVLATTEKKEDDVLADCVTHLKNVIVDQDPCDFECFRGSENDVLDRYYQAAKKYDADTIVRLTADNPLFSPQIADFCIELREMEGLDYLGFLDVNGLDVEVFTFDALEKMWNMILSPYHREHVTTHIRDNPSEYNMKLLSDFSFTVDTMEDLEFVRKLSDVT